MQGCHRCFTRKCSPMSDAARVIIAGAGPTGLVAALLAARQSIPVLVLEAEAQPLAEQRGAAFHPPTLEILAELGLEEALRAIGLVVPVWQIRDRDTGVIAEFDLSVLRNETPYPYRFHLGQHLLVPVLLDALRCYPHAEIRFGRAVMDVTQHADGVVVTAGPMAERFAGSWLIGADGGRSSVRKSVGITLEGFTWPERFLVTNVQGDLEARGFARTNYISDPESWAVVLKLSDADGSCLWRITYPTDSDVAEETALAEPGIRCRLNEIVPESDSLPLRYAGLYRVHQRVAETFRAGRVLLAGDAAHLNNPLGGFGLNGAVHDAANLIAKLAPVWRGEADADLLDRYVRQRRYANIKYVQETSIRNKRVLEERDSERRRLSQEELRRTAEDPVLARRYLLNSSMITSVRDAQWIE